MQQEDETGWWLRFIHGEQLALAFFYEHYADWLLKYGLSVVYNRELVQERAVGGSRRLKSSPFRAIKSW